jgi:rubrerythrin
MNRQQLEELLYQSLETERGGVQVYDNAVKCAQNDDLKKERVPRPDPEP